MAASNDERDLHAASPADVADALLADLAPDLAKAGKARLASKNLPGLGTIFQRGTPDDPAHPPIWWIVYHVNAKRRRESSKSTRESDAVKLLRKRIEECGKGLRRDPVAENKLRMGALLDALKADYKAHGRRSVDTLAFRLTPLREAFGQDRAVDVTAARIAKYRDDRLTAGKARATVNRELAALRRAFALAKERDQLATVPTVKLLTEDNARQGFVTRAHFDTIAAALPAYLCDAATFGYLTGWRRGEIITLEWRDVDLDGGRITLRREESKNKLPRTVPFDVAGEGAGIFAQLGALVARRVAARTETGDGARFVFHRDGHRLVDFRKAWDTACDGAGHAGLLFHDLRRSAVRNLVDAGIDQRVAMAITGHQTVSVFQRYRIVNDDDVRKALQRVQATPGAASDGA